MAGGGTISSSTDVGDGDMNDMITDLPEGILLHILSLLPTKDAIRTSILAKKWRNMWTYLSVFDFETGYPRYDSNYRNQKDMSNFLLDLVGRLICKSNRIERLGIQIFRNTVDADKVSSLITSASNHKIQCLRLSLGDLDDEVMSALRLSRNNEFVLPHSFSAFESLSELHLGFTFTLHVPSGICFPSLKKLDVSNVSFANENSVQQLFSGCPVLQELELYNCDWKNIQQINVAISTLRKLRIRFDGFCADYDHDMTVKIDVVNLISLNCSCNPTIEFIPVNLTSLVDAYINLGYDYPHSEPYAAQCVIELLRGLSSVKSLKIYNNILECLSHAKDTLHLLPSFHNLTHLYVYSGGSPESTNGVLLDILRKTPKLEVLTIPGVVLNYLDDDDLILNSLPYCFKSSLNRLSISNFYGDEYEIQFVTFILNSSPYLGEIEIHCSRHFTADVEVTDVWNQLEDVGLERCVIKFLYSEYDESSDDEGDEDEAANSGVLPAAEAL